MARRKKTRGARREAELRARAGFSGSLLRRTLVFLIALKVFAIIVVFDPAGLQAFELPKSIVSRAFAWPMAGVLGICLFKWGIWLFPRTPIHLGVLAVCLASLVSTLLAPVPYVALFGERGSYLGMSFLTDMVVLYLAAAAALRDERDLDFVARWALAGFAISAAYAVLQFLGLDPFRWSADPRRPFSVFGSTVRYAHFLGVAFGIAVATAVLLGEGRSRRLRTIAVSTALIALTVAGAAGSRGVFIGVGAALLALLALSLPLQRLGRQQVLVVAGATMVSAVVAAFLLITSPAGQRAGERLVDLAAEERLFIYESGIEALKSRPITGFGPDSFSVGYTAHRTLSSTALGADVIENSAHNWILQAAVTTGILGLVALLAMLLLWARAVVGALSRGSLLLGPLAVGAAAYWAQGLVSVGSMSVDWFPWLAIGATAAFGGQQAPLDDEGRYIPPWIQWILLGALSIGATSGVFALSANRAAWDASQAFAGTQPRRAVDAATRAVETDAGRADHWNWLGLALTLEQRWRDSGDAFARAAASAPYDSTYWQNLARSRMLQSLSGDLSSGGPAAATEAAERAIEAEPVEVSSYALAAEIEYSLGRPDRAIEIAVLAMQRLDQVLEDTVVKASKVAADSARAQSMVERLVESRDSLELRLAVARLALRAKDYEAARDNARRVLAIDPGNVEAQQIIQASGG